MPVPKFGRKIEGITYVDRPGVYALVEKYDHRIAVIETTNGFFLPGGGIDPGETEVDALKRELLEEIGFQISVVEEIGAAVEYIKAAKEAMYYQIRSKFYKVKLELKIGDGIESDHRLRWLTYEEVLNLLTRRSQVWAVQSLGNAQTR